jgi:hypothetical protein
MQYPTEDGYNMRGIYQQSANPAATISKWQDLQNLADLLRHMIYVRSHDVMIHRKTYWIEDAYSS